MACLANATSHSVRIRLVGAGRSRLTPTRATKVSDADHSKERPSLRIRFAAAIVATGLCLIIFFATRLSPDPRGFGTHQQLGLPECAFKSAIGKRCPHCGMTTSMTYLVRGQWRQAWNANPGGYVLTLLIACGVPLFGSVAVRGRYWLTKDPFQWLFVSGLTYVGFVLLMWITRTFLLRI